MTRSHWHNCQPVDMHRLARDWFVNAKRIELQKLARTLGISRATAYRWAGSAEQLIGDVLASLVEDAFKHILATSTAQGSEKVLEVLERGMRAAHQFVPLQQFLAANPTLGLRVVASKHGPVQKRTMQLLQDLIQEEVDAGRMHLSVTPATMAFALTRLVESFLYADLITDTRLDHDQASKVLQLMLKETG